MLDIALIIGEFITQVSAYFLSKVRVGHRTDPAENNNASDIKRPFPFFPESAVIYAE